MALQSSGQISIFNIRTEKGLSGQVSLSSLSTSNINQYSTKPDGVVPHRIKEFYLYQHIATMAFNVNVPGYSVYARELYWSVTGGYVSGFQYQMYNGNSEQWENSSQSTASSAGTSGVLQYGLLIGIPQRIQFTVLDSSSRYIYFETGAA